MSIYTDSKTKRLFIQFDFNRKTYKTRLPEGTTKAQAVKLETKLKNEAFFDNHGIGNSPDDIMWETFVCNVYLEYVEANQSKASLERAIGVLKASMPFFKGLPFRSIKPADVEKFKTSRMILLTRFGSLRQPATIHREMAIISRVFSMAVRNDLCDYNPCSRIDLPKFDNVQDRILHKDDEVNFLSAFRNSFQRDICTVVLYSGLRQNDVLGLSKQHIDWQSEQITLIQGKTKRRVNIPIHPKVSEILQRRMEIEGDLLFPSYRTGKQAHSIKNSIRCACIRAHIPILTIRDLRRTFGTRLHEDGVDDTTVAGLLGHSGLRSVYRYKRGTEIKKKAILNLGISTEPAKIPTTIQEWLSEENLKLLKTLVETRGIEPLTSAMPLHFKTQQIH